MVGNRVPAGPLPLQRSRQKAANLQSGPSTPTSSLRTTTIRSSSPHSRNSPTTSNASREDGENEEKHVEQTRVAECHTVPEAKTPKVLWASTPTPKASRSTYSFALPPEGPQGLTSGVGKLNPEAATFIPVDETGLVHSHGQQIPQVSHGFEPSEFHAEAQAVMMAESVLGLDADPKQAPLVQVPHTDSMETQDGHGGPTPAKMPSKGSALHQQGQCRPCAWMWKPRGCQNAEICEYCHLCPEGELKHRKKMKIAAIRMGALAALGPPDSGAARRGLKLSTLL